MPQFPVDPEADRAVKGIPGPEAPPDSEDPPPGQQVIELEDGSALVVDPSPVPQSASPFHENLAERLDQSFLGGLATKYLELVDLDRQARERRVKQYEDGLKRSGLSGEAPGGAPFDGASRVVHPVLVEAAVDFQATAMRELHPPGGPVKTFLKGKEDREAIRRAERKAKFLNWQLTTQIEEYRPQKERLLAQLPFGGSQYMKWYPDRQLGRPACEFVRLDDMLLPYAARSFYTARRQTHVLHLTQEEFEERVEIGLYRDVSGAPPSMEPELTPVAEQQQKIEGKEAPGQNEDGLREDYEIYTWLAVKADPLTRGKRAPYILTVSAHDQQVLALYRNWREGDARMRKLEWFVAWPFIPWDGVYDLGLFHLIGGLSVASTGALRSLLDSALVNNMPGGLRLKGARVSGQTRQGDPTQFMEIEGTAGIDDIRKVAMPYPFNPPSTVLFTLLGWLTDAAKGVVTTAEEKIKDASNQMPVGTALALIESGAKVMGAIHARLHAAQAKEFEILSRLNAMHYTDAELAEAYGEPIVSRKDFAVTDDVQPVSDPNIFSEGQRYAQVQAAMQMSADPRVQYNVYELHRMAYERMKFPEIDRILPEPPKPTELNSVAENLAVLAGRPLAAFPGQDHLSHLEVHLRFCLEPFIATDPQAILRVYPQQLEHARQHIVFFYARLMHDAVSAAAGMDLDEVLAEGKSAYARLDSAFAAAADRVSREMRAAFADTGVIPMLGMMAKVVQQLMPPPPKDPTTATVEAAMAETHRRAARDKEELAIANKEQMIDAQREIQELQNKMRETADKSNAAAQEFSLKQAEFLKDLSAEREALNLEKRQFALEAMEKISNLQNQIRMIGRGETPEEAKAKADMGEQAARHAQFVADTVGQFSARLDALEAASGENSARNLEKIQGIMDSFGGLMRAISSPREAVLSNGRRVRIGPAGPDGVREAELPGGRKVKIGPAKDGGGE